MLAAAALVATPVAGASTSPGSSGPDGALAPTGSAESLLAIPENVTPQPNRLITQGFNGTCYTWITADVVEEGWVNSAGVPRHTVDSVGLGDCPASATLSWENVDTGATGDYEITEYGPSHPKSSVIPSGAGEVHFTLTPAFDGPSASTTVQVPVYED